MSAQRELHIDDSVSTPTRPPVCTSALGRVAPMATGQTADVWWIRAFIERWTTGDFRFCCHWVMAGLIRGGCQPLHSAEVD